MAKIKCDWCDGSGEINRPYKGLLVQIDCEYCYGKGYTTYEVKETDHDG